jgi:CBS domain-containing protein
MSLSSITDRLGGLLDNTPPFNTLPDEERRRLLGKMTLEIFGEGDVVIQQGEDIHDALYIVESGLVRLMDREEGRVRSMAGEGAVFGTLGLMKGGLLPYEAMAVEPTVIALLTAEEFKRLYKEHEGFRQHFDEDLKRYVRIEDADIDASGAYLLFDTAVGDVVHREAIVRPPTATAEECARAMAESDADTVVLEQDGLPIGLVTEGDLLKRVVGAGQPLSTEAMTLVRRPPVTLRASERLFDAVRAMMEHRIRRVVVTGDDGEGGERILGLVTSEDIGHFRGLDPVATTERLEKAATVDELASLRNESNRRLYRLYQQGVQSEDLYDVISEIDDQLKARLFHLVEDQAIAEHPDKAYDGKWAWMAFGPTGRREATLAARQDNGLVYAAPDPADAERAARWYGILAERITSAMARCGYSASEAGITAASEPFRQPLSSWLASYMTWVGAADAGATQRAALCFDLRTIHGDSALVDDIRHAIRERLGEGSDRFVRVLLRQGTQAEPPLNFFGGFALDKDGASEGLDLRERGLKPVVDTARALALDAGFVRSTNTFDRLRHVIEADTPVSGPARDLLTAYSTLADLHLRYQMQAAELGGTASDRVDPADLSKSQQNLLKEMFKKMQKAQEALGKRARA